MPLDGVAAGLKGPGVLGAGERERGPPGSVLAPARGIRGRGGGPPRGAGVVAPADGAHTGDEGGGAKSQWVPGCRCCRNGGGSRISGKGGSGSGSDTAIDRWFDPTGNACGVVGNWSPVGGEGVAMVVISVVSASTGIIVRLYLGCSKIMIHLVTKLVRAVPVTKSPQ